MHASSRPATFAGVLLLAATAILASPAAYTQSQSINGSIRGIVTDATGAAVPNASVLIKNLDTGYTRQLSTDSAGLYVAPALPIGHYSVTGSAPGFAPLTQTGIQLDAGVEANVNEALKTGSVATEVEVSSDAPILELTRTGLSRTISSVETQNLPLTSRNPYNFILFQPGVSGHPNPENGIPRTVNTNGLVDRINYQLDGMVDTESDRYGLRLFAISDSYTDSVQTISNAFTPEFGNTAGIIYNVITPSGTNQLRGSVAVHLAPQGRQPPAPSSQNCDLTVVGGKAKPDLHVDDLVGQPRRSHHQAIACSSSAPTSTSSAATPSCQHHQHAPNPVFRSPPAESILLSDFATAPQVQRAQWVDVRGDIIRQSARTTLFVRYNYFRNTYPYNTNAGGLYALERRL